jgi:hypothetical protein
MPSRLEVAEERRIILQSAVDDVVARIEKAKELYGPRIRANGGVDAILEAARARLSKPGRKSKASEVSA